MKLTLSLALVTLAALGGCSDPDAEARRHDRLKIELCEKDLNDPLLSASTKLTVVRPVCEGFKADFRAKYKAEP